MKCLVLWQFPLYVVLGFLITSICTAHATVDTPIDEDNDKEQHHINFNETSRLPTNLSGFNNSAMETVYVTASSTDINRQSQQEQHSNRTNSEEDSLEEQLKDDQVALRRMVLILSLVGGLGAVAVITTIVIFTKMRRRKRRRITNKTNSPTDQYHYSKPTTDRYTHRHRHQQRRGSNGSNSNSNGNNSDNSDNSNSVATSHWNEATSSSHQEPGAIINTVAASSNPLSLTIPQPSAPPPATYTISPTVARLPCHHRRVITMIPQRQLSAATPEPSAPTAKELESNSQVANTDPCTLCDPRHHHRHNQHHHSIDRELSSAGTTAVAMTPEIPPPAYTPSAPPLYQGIHPPVVHSQQQIQLARRHSQS